MNDGMFPNGRVTILGVLNVTPDSFSDGGRFVREGSRGIDVEAALDAGRRLMEDGADWLDVGGESTRPGSEGVSADVEVARVVPIIESLASRLGGRVSVDTRKAEVASAAIRAGATAVNDVSGGSDDPDLVRVVADSPGVHLILGHMRGTPMTMQQAPRYDDVLREVALDLEASLAAARRAGVSEDRLAIDPGIGFGKELEANLELIAHAGWFRERLGRPVLVGPSRKSFLGRITGDPVGAREVATQAACAVAAFAGADGVRVHEPAPIVRAIAVGRALRDARRKELS
ncbi:MAG: dihydropteroate synthase [Myxococcota bacterium]|nr:dihydropteroate synthase [Myxococcota bacterium]